MHSKASGKANRLAWRRVGVVAGWGAAASVLAVVGLASATPPADVIVAEVDPSTYQHYHQDLLYTYLGDNRGFGPEHDLARENIFNELSDQPHLSVELDPFQYNGTTYYNVVATQTGTDFPDEIYVVGAHFDSVNNPGADDNATGTALVMETARVLSQHRSPRTILYVAFDREEQGLRGSHAFVADHAGDDIVQAVVADMVGHDGAGVYGMNIYGSSLSTGVMQGLAGAIDVYGQGLGAYLSGSASFSDHWSFESVGIPACVVIERCYQCNPYYHTPNDAVDNPFFPDGDYLDYSMPTNLVRSFVGYLVDEIGVRLWHDNDNDADVDKADFAAMQRCFGSAVAGACLSFDANQDGAVNIDDFEDFLASYTGPGDNG